ncbi:MAG: 3-deoxy-D-manno-octulosonic acid transferase [Methylococcaceae bacterium]|nr:3-deoxy-D-manno-octulosonic acid transferase [Methylococcaceae bacterium]
MRALYSLLFFLLIPFILIRLLWRSIKAPAYRHRWHERLGFYPNSPHRIDIWFHAVSVGEAEAVFPLVRKIQHHHPDARLLITTTTPTGSARVTSTLQDTVEHVYLPYDIPIVINRFMLHFNPRIGVIMETEIWPNLFAACGAHKIPLYIINARLSEKSSRGYQKIPSLIQPALANVELIGTQSKEDADRFITIGAPPDIVKTLGNIKYDVEIPQTIVVQGLQLKEDLFAERFVWLIASTHKGEEILFLDIFKELKAKIPALLLVFVPRHPERFGEVKKLCELQNFNVITRTSQLATSPQTDIYLVDTMGELKMFYAAADSAFVGGSMVPKGGHNILEAAAIGVPVLFGPFMSNFKDIAHGVLKHQAGIQCPDKEAVIAAMLNLYTRADDRQALIAKGKRFIDQNQGAIHRIYTILEQALNKIN